MINENDILYGTIYKIVKNQKLLNGLIWVNDLKSSYFNIILDSL